MEKHTEKGREEKTKFSKILPNNQIITACCIELQVQEMTMNQKLTDWPKYTPSQNFLTDSPVGL